MEYRIYLPKNENQLPIHEEYFFIIQDNGEEQRIRLHDYATIYSIPGLYEQLAIEMLGYQSHEFMADFLARELNKERVPLDEVNILELGAGSGLFGRELYKNGIKSLIGVDIVPEAAAAANYGENKIYQDYLIEDFTKITPHSRKFLIDQKPNVFVCCSALSQGHIPIEALETGVNLINDNGWILFNVSASSYQNKDHEIMVFFEEAMRKGQLQMVSMENYIHRKFCNGDSLEYVALLLKKNSTVD